MALRCTSCCHVFSRRSSLTRHLQNCLSSKTKTAFVCLKCRKTFIRRDTLRRHENALHGGGKKECPLCLHKCRGDYFDQHQRLCLRRQADLEPFQRVLCQSDLLGVDLRSASLDVNFLTSTSAKSNKTIIDRSETRLRVTEGTSRPAYDQPKSVYTGCHMSGLEALAQSRHIRDVFMRDDLPGLLRIFCLVSSHHMSVLNFDKLVNIKILKQRRASSLLDAATAFNGKIIMQSLLDRDDINVNQGFGPCRRTALHRIVQHDDVDALQLLLTYGATVDPRDTNNTTPLELAIFHRRYNMIEALIRRGADVNGYKSYHSPLCLACSDDGLGEIVELLLVHGAEVNHCSLPILTALERGPGSTVARLLYAGARVDTIPSSVMEILTYRSTRTGQDDSSQKDYPDAAFKLRLLQEQQGTAPLDVVERAAENRHDSHPRSWSQVATNVCT